MKIYTKTGDGGTTALIGGERVSKTDLRVEAYGTVDELIAFTAVLSDALRERTGPDGRNRPGAKPDEAATSNESAKSDETAASQDKTVAALKEAVAELDRINSRLMTVSALLAVGAGGEGKVPGLPTDAVAALESSIDRMQASLKPLTKFTIPGGCSVVSSCHVCRTVCRRAERAALRARAEHPADDRVLVYLNRLSDYFYTLGRHLTEMLDAPEILWIP